MLRDVLRNLGVGIGIGIYDMMDHSSTPRGFKQKTLAKTIVLTDIINDLSADDPELNAAYEADMQHSMDTFSESSLGLQSLLSTKETAWGGKPTHYREALCWTFVEGNISITDKDSAQWRSSISCQSTSCTVVTTDEDPPKQNYAAFRQTPQKCWGQMISDRDEDLQSHSATPCSMEARHGRENHNYRRKIKEAIQIYKRQPALNRDQGMEIPAITLKLLSCGPTGSHDEWCQPTHIPLKMAARFSPKIREQFFCFPSDSVSRKTLIFLRHGCMVFQHHAGKLNQNHTNLRKLFSIKSKTRCQPGRHRSAHRYLPASIPCRCRPSHAGQAM